MNPNFHELVQAQIRAAREYGTKSPENRQALRRTRAWQDRCKHEFTKVNRHEEIMCSKCNYPKK